MFGRGIGNCCKRTRKRQRKACPARQSGLRGTGMSPVPRRQDPDMRRLHEIIETV